MFNAKLVIVSGAGIASAWKFWPDALGAHPLLVVFGALLFVWVFLVATICVLDHRRRHVLLRKALHPDAHSMKVAALEPAGLKD